MRTVLRSGVVDGVKKPDTTLVNSEVHRQVALEAAQEGIVLLKNQRQTLPLDATKIRSIALIGPAASEMQIGADGSPRVTPLHIVGPIEGIKTRLGAGVTVRTVSGESNGDTFPARTLVAAGTNETGFKAEYFANKNFEGKPTLSRTDAQISFRDAPVGLGPNNWSARWSATLTPRKSGPTTFLMRADDGCRLFVDGKAIIDHWQDSAASTQSATITLTTGQKYELRAEYYQSGGGQIVSLGWSEAGAKPYSEAIEVARQSDVAVVFVTTRDTEGEGHDRPSMALPDKQDELIRQVVAANPKTIVVLNNGTPVLMPWLNSVPALLEAWFPGQEGGHALAQVLFGDINPSGHLPTTLGAKREDYPDFGSYPGKDGNVTYNEGIYVGYRAFDKRNIAPLFPFGHGLSYTTFRIDRLKLSAPTLNTTSDQLTVNVRIANTGKRAGAEVVQLYVSEPNPKTDKAIRELKGFSKVFLQPGQSQIVTLPLKPRDFAWCDVKSKGWRVDAGDYFIEVGDSSRNLAQKTTVHVASFFEAIPFLQEALFDNSPDLARGKPAFAASEQKEAGKTYKAADAFDGNAETRWSSDFQDNQWLAVDLGQKRRIGRVKLKWEAAYATDYRIEVSDDNQNWREVYSTDKGQGGDDEISFAPVEARYVRLFCVKRSTPFGSSLFSFEVRAPLSGT